MNATDEIIWHDVENGSYEADLPVWRELAGAASGPVLEAGCGTGRVTLDLARLEHHVLGFDIDPALVAKLNERAGSRGLEARGVAADLRDFEVEGSFALAMVPMQTIQLLASADERIAAMRALASTLSDRALVAVAIVEGDLGAGAPGFELDQPLPDVAEVDGWVYSSLPLEIRPDGERIVVSRLRQVVAPDGDLTEELSELSLAVVDAASIQAEALQAGLAPAGTRDIPATADHIGSTVALLERAS